MIRIKSLQNAGMLLVSKSRNKIEAILFFEGQEFSIIWYSDDVMIADCFSDDDELTENFYNEISNKFIKELKKMKKVFYYAGYEETNKQVARFETEAQRDAWVQYQDEMSKALGATKDNATFSRVSLTPEQAETVTKKQHYKSKDEYTPGLVWLVA